MQPFVWLVRVYYEDTDAGGLVYHANYIKFLERARTEWLRSRGYEQDVLIKRQGLLLAVRSLTVEYEKPARFNEMLYVGVRIRQLKRASIVFEQLITRLLESGGEDVLTRAVVKVASLDAVTLKPKLIPQSLRQDLEHAD